MLEAELGAVRRQAEHDAAVLSKRSQEALRRQRAGLQSQLAVAQRAVADADAAENRLRRELTLDFASKAAELEQGWEREVAGAHAAAADAQREVARLDSLVTAATQREGEARRAADSAERDAAAAREQAARLGWEADKWEGKASEREAQAVGAVAAAQGAAQAAVAAAEASRAALEQQLADVSAAAEAKADALRAGQLAAQAAAAEVTLRCENALAQLAACQHEQAQLRLTLTNTQSTLRQERDDRATDAARVTACVTAVLSAVQERAADLEASVNNRIERLVRSAASWPDCLCHVPSLSTCTLSDRCTTCTVHAQARGTVLLSCRTLEWSRQLTVQ